jgi:hypothetical protein
MAQHGAARVKCVLLTQLAQNETVHIALGLLNGLQ